MVSLQVQLIIVLLILFFMFGLAFPFLFTENSSLNLLFTYTTMLSCAHAFVHLVLFLWAKVCLPVCQHCLCVFPIASDSEDDGKLVCTCENEKGTCVNGTCRGDVCFYTRVPEYEERGCFLEKNRRENCMTSFKGFHIYCCSENYCNAYATPPPGFGQYLELCFVLMGVKASL